MREDQYDDKMVQAQKTTQEFIPIKDIRDGVVILKDNSMKLILMVSSINFALKSEDEQTAILLQFQNFLNSLDFSIQFFIQSKRLDIIPYLETLTGRVDAQENELLKIQTQEYIEFVKNFAGSVNIMSKTFYVVIPYYPPVINTESGFIGKILGKKGETPTTEERFEESKIQLEQRAGVVEDGLSSVGLRSARLGTEELAELFYKLFNPGERTKPPLAEVT